MQVLLTALFVSFCLFTSGRWSNNADQFNNNLHMPINTAIAVRTNSIVVTSFSCSRYFLFWKTNKTPFATPHKLMHREINRNETPSIATDCLHAGNYLHRQYGNEKTVALKFMKE
jgi:hypothetical protein